MHCTESQLTRVPDVARAPTILYNTRQISLNTRLKLRIFHVSPSQPTYLTFPCVHVFSPTPMLRFACICKWVIRDSTFGRGGRGNVTKRFNKCNEYRSHFWLYDRFEGRGLSIETSLFIFDMMYGPPTTIIK